jgi:hypothetical protein
MTNFSLRINEEVMRVIKEKSELEKVSVNHVVNNLLENATSWSIYAPCAGWIPMPKQILFELIERLSYDEIESLANKLGKQLMRDILLFTQGKYDFDSFINFLKIRSSVSGFQFSEQREGNTITCVVHHGMGKKWAVWFRRFYEIALTDMKMDCSFDVSENTFTMIIRK